MARILKYPLEITDTQYVNLHEGAEILSAQMQNGVLCIWALSNDKAPKVPVCIRIVGTGHLIDDVDAAFLIPIDTVQDGALVWHVFEECADIEEETHERPN